MVDVYDRDTWTTAWGANTPVIVGGINDEFKLPLLPPDYDWLLTRETTGGKPTYRLSLLYCADVEDGFEVVRRGLIDKTMYGESGVVELARTIKERHCPERRASRPVSTVESEIRARIARRSTSSERTRPAPG